VSVRRRRRPRRTRSAVAGPAAVCTPCTVRRDEPHPQLEARLMLLGDEVLHPGPRCVAAAGRSGSTVGYRSAVVQPPCRCHVPQTVPAACHVAERLLQSHQTGLWYVRSLTRVQLLLKPVFPAISYGAILVVQNLFLSDIALVSFVYKHWRILL